MAILVSAESVPLAHTHTADVYPHGRLTAFSASLRGSWKR